MTPTDYIVAYERALASQDWKRVEPLISEKACVTFSNGSVHRGRDAVQIAYEHNFSSIKNEEYKIENVIWLRQELDYAVYLFEYNWTGIINGSLVSGSGLGTTVIIMKDGCWKLLTEHLGKK